MSQTAGVWTGRLAVLLALLSLSGLDRALVQTYAWITMVHDRTEELGVEGALQDTFSGEHPCEICQAVAEAAHEKPENAPTREGTENVAKMFSSLFKGDLLKLNPPSDSSELVVSPTLANRSIIHELPTPPPRWV